MSALTDIATPLTQQVLQRRRRRGELAPPTLDATNRQRYAVTVQMTHRVIVRARRTCDLAELVGAPEGSRRHGE